MIPKNRVSELRKSAKLTAAGLSKRAQVPAWPLRLVEAGIGHVRLMYAFRIAAALEKAPEMVFPAAGDALRRLGELGGNLKGVSADGELAEGFETAGIDPDPFQWSVRYSLDGGIFDVEPISSIERRWLWSAVGEPVGRNPKFVVINGLGRRIAINIRHMEFCQFLFDREPFTGNLKNKARAATVDLYFAGSRKPWKFDVERDDTAMEDAADDNAAPLRHLLREMEQQHRGEPMFRFTDIDGEQVVFRGSALAQISVPLELLESSLADSNEEVEI